MSRAASTPTRGSRASSRGSAYLSSSLGDPASATRQRQRPGTAGAGGRRQPGAEPPRLGGRVTSGYPAPGGGTLSGTRAVGEWAAATQRLLLSAAGDKVRSGCVRAGARAVKHRAAADAGDHDRSVHVLLERKLAQTSALRHKLQRAIDSVCDEIGQLDRARVRSVDALNARQAPLDLSQQRLRVRKTRPSRENLDDDAQRALRAQADDLCHSVRLLEQDVRAIDALLGQLHHSRSVLSADLADKERALALDAGCLDLPAEEKRQKGGFRDRLGAAMSAADALLGSGSALSSTEQGSRAEDVRALAASTGRHHPTEWREATHRSIRAAAEFVAAGGTLRSAAREHIKELAKSNVVHDQRVRKALAERMRATAALHSGLAERIREMGAELQQLERDRVQTEHALRQKELPFHQCIERLAIRRERPPRESAADDVEQGLKEQLGSMASAIRKLESGHDAIVAKQDRLQRMKRSLELDRSDKASAVEVDKQAYNCTSLSAAAPQAGAAASVSASLLEQTQRIERDRTPSRHGGYARAP